MARHKNLIIFGICLVLIAVLLPISPIRISDYIGGGDL